MKYFLIIFLIEVLRLSSTKVCLIYLSKATEMSNAMLKYFVVMKLEVFVLNCH